MAKNPLSSLSYTNKDFTSIYVELLDIVKELSSKWDPTISNESDPGVILLKADAIIADKNNYNIDKNILEIYPETVTQELNARNNYKQLAYSMPWYKSATTTLTFKWVGRDFNLGESATIKKYTMVTNETGDVVYTTLADATLNADTLVATAPAIEGTLNTLTINGSSVIDIVNLDENNRIYLPDYSVAENGVFVTNVGSQALWEQVDNLQVRTQGNMYYEFGVDSRNSVCYIEFPQDIDTLIGSGIEIRYMLSQGASGNMSAATVDRFYSDESITVGNDSFVLNEEIVTLYNASASTDGANPESLQQAYRSYRKTAGTFKTLVTLRDYINSIYNSGLVSNAIVSDRLNDIQSSYTIKTEDTVNPFVTQFHKSSTGVVSYFIDTPQGAGEEGWFKYQNREMISHTPTESEIEAKAQFYRRLSDNYEVDMNAFDLKLYLLHTPGIIDSIDDYESTFNLESPGSVVETEVKGYIYDQQCVQHDFVSIMENLPCLYKNSYPIGVKIVPQHYLTPIQIDQVKQNIVTALWDVCNSRAIEFGEEPDYDIIYDAIQNADERIKVVILDEFKYTTYATYWDAAKKEFKDVPISKTESQLVIAVEDETDLAYHKKHSTTVRLNSAYFVTTDTFTYSGENIEKGSVLKYNSRNNKFELYSDKRNEFQLDVIAKSVLAGTTPLYKEDSSFVNQLNHTYVDDLTTERITTALILSPFSNGRAEVKIVDINDDDINETIVYPVTDNTQLNAEYKLKANETLRLLAPAFETETNYSNYVKFELVLNHSTGTQETSVEYNESIPDDTGDSYHLVYASEYDEQLYNAVKTSLFNLVDREGKDILSFSAAELTKTHNVRILTEANTRCLQTDTYGNVTSEALSFQDNAIWSASITKVTDGYNVVLKQGNKYLTVDNGKVVCKATPECFWRVTPIKLPLFVQLDSDVDNDYSCTFHFNADNQQLLTVNSLQKASKVVYADGQQWFDPAQIAVRFTENMSDAEYKQGDLWLRYKYVKSGASAEFKNEKVIIFNSWAAGDILLYELKNLYTIPANTDYQLCENDYITFFWRTEDSEDAPYKYIKYTGISSTDMTSTKQSPIIRPTFTVNGVGIDEAQVNPTTLNSEGEIAYGSKEYTKVYGFYGDNDLSGTKAIEIRKMNQVVLNSGKNNYYFITNKIVQENDTDHYKMVMKSLKEPSEFARDEQGNIIGSYRYTLQSDEYFINTNKTLTEYEILGPGSLIGLNVTFNPSEEQDVTNTFELDVQAVLYQDVIISGIKAFGDYCKSIPATYEMYCREQQIYNIVANDTLMIKMNDSNSVKSRPIFTSWNDTLIDKDFEISYKSSSGEIITLPQINIQSDECSWSGRACLNLNISSEEPQLIEGISKDSNNNYDYKSIQMLMLESTNDIGDSAYRIYPDFNTTNFSVKPEQLYIQSDVFVNKVGGTNIDISYVDLLGDRKAVDLYLYALNDVFTTSPFSIRDDGAIICNMIDMTNQTATVEVMLDTDGKYMLSIDNLSEEIKLSVEVNNVPALSLSSKSQFVGAGMSYYILEPAQKHTIKFSIDKVADTNSDHFIINSLFKFIDNNLFETEYGITTDNILDRIRTLDVDSIFKYNNVVTDKDEIYIEDPLNGKSFFNSNHVMNQFTIGKAELRLSDSTDAYILPINNR